MRISSPQDKRICLMQSGIPLEAPIRPLPSWHCRFTYQQEFTIAGIRVVLRREKKKAATCKIAKDGGAEKNRAGAERGGNRHGYQEWQCVEGCKSSREGG